MEARAKGRETLARCLESRRVAVNPYHLTVGTALKNRLRIAAAAKCAVQKTTPAAVGQQGNSLPAKNALVEKAVGHSLSTDTPLVFSSIC